MSQSTVLGRPLSLHPPPDCSHPVSRLPTPCPTAPGSSTQQHRPLRPRPTRTPSSVTSPPTPRLDTAKHKRLVPTPARSPHTTSGPHDERASPGAQTKGPGASPGSNALSPAFPPHPPTPRRKHPDASHQHFSPGLFLLPPHSSQNDPPRTQAVTELPAVQNALMEKGRSSPRPTGPCRTRLRSSPHALPGAHSRPAPLASRVLLLYIKDAPASGRLRLLFPLPRTLFPQITSQAGSRTSRRLLLRCHSIREN